MTPCTGCHKCHILRKQFKHEDDRRRPCCICQGVPKPPGSIQQRTHYASHCHFRFSVWDKQKASAICRLRNTYPNKCIVCSQGHNVVVCHHERNIRFLNKVARKRREAKSAWAKPKIQQVLKFHSEADVHTLPHFKSGTKKQAWTYTTMN